MNAESRDFAATLLVVFVNVSFQLVQAKREVEGRKFGKSEGTGSSLAVG
jgi:hypothetical protein